LALPTDFDTVAVHGSYDNIDGTPASGTITFTATTRLRSAATQTAILPGSITVALDANGEVNVALPVTDDPDITPPGWVWRVDEKFGPVEAPTFRRSYDMLAPAGTPIDLTAAQPAGPPEVPPVTPWTTVVGKTPDAEGDIKVYVDDLYDATVDTPTSGQVLVYDGTQWVNQAAPPGTGDLQSTANLSDLANITTARTNLGLGTSATRDVGTASNTVAAGDDTRITGAAQKAGNLTDLADKPAARTNLGLGDAATKNTGTTTGSLAAGDDARIVGAAQKAANLSDVNATTARTNLGLGTAATRNVGTTTGTVAAGDDTRFTSAAQKTYVPVANGTHFNGNWANPATSLIAGPVRQSRKLLRVLTGGATELVVEWANKYTITIPPTPGASCEINGPNNVNVRMAIEYPAGNPRLVSGSTAYSATTAYAVMDQVTSGGGSWVCIQAGTGQTPADGSAYWRRVNRYTVRWDNDDSAGTVTFLPGDYKRSQPLALSEIMLEGDCIAVLGAFDAGSSSGRIPYAGTNGACNIAPFVDWIVDAASMPAAGSGITATGITNQTNGSTTAAGNTDHTTWTLIPYATAITGNIPTDRCVAICGDSIAQGFGGDIRDGEPCGLMPRLLDGATWWRLAQGGNRALCYYPGNAPWQMSVLRRTTSTVLNLALNDMLSGSDAPTIQKDLQRTWKMHAANGGPLYGGLLTPMSNSTDAFATTANQTRFTTGGIPTTQFPADDATYLTSVYGQVALWISQEGAPITLPTGETVRAGQQGHPITAFLDWRGFLADAATSWKWNPSLTTDGAHPNAVAVANQIELSAEQFPDVILGGNRPETREPTWDPTGAVTMQSMPRSQVKDLSPAVSSTLFSVVDVSQGDWYSQIRAWCGTGTVGSKTATVLSGADPAKLKVLYSATIGSPPASSLMTLTFTGAPVWIPRGHLIAVAWTPAPVSGYGGATALHASLHTTGSGVKLAGTSADTVALTGPVNAITKFTASTFRLWHELV
jgi:hypothetical protein